MSNDSHGDEEGDTHSPDMLYRRYRQTRRMSAVHRGDDDRNGNARKENVHGEPNNEAEGLYQRYQATRHSGSLATDGIISAIDQSISLGESVQLNQPAVGASVSDVHQVEARQGWVVAGAVPANDATSKASNVFKRFALPVIAAAVLGIVVFPLIKGTSNQTDYIQATLPSSLSDHADQLVIYIEPRGNGPLAFASAENSPGTAFRHGVIATDLMLILNSAMVSKAIPLLLELSESDSMVVAGAMNVRQSAEIMFNAIGDQEKNNEVQKHLDKLLASLRESAQQSKQLDWYFVGKSVESIRIAGKFASDTTNTEPLVKALALGRELPLPEQPAPASRALATLFEYRLPETDQLIQVQKVLKTASDIESIMY